MVIGDGRPFIAALITLDTDAARRTAGDGTAGEPHRDDGVIAEVGAAVEDANQEVSRAEAIRAFRILDRPFSPERDELTPTGKPRRQTILEHFAAEVEDIYAA